METKFLSQAVMLGSAEMLSRVSGFLLLRKSTWTMLFLKINDELISKRPKILILDHVFLCLSQCVKMDLNKKSLPKQTNAHSIIFRP